VSATLAFSLAQALKLDFPIFALAAAVIATDLIPMAFRSDSLAISLSMLS
jgi:hypothetical protein